MIQDLGMDIMKIRTTVTLDQDVWEVFQAKCKGQRVQTSTCLNLILIRVLRSGDRLEDFLLEAKGKK